MKWKQVERGNVFDAVSVIRFISTKVVLHDALRFIRDYPNRISDLEYLDESESPSTTNQVLVEELGKVLKKWKAYVGNLEWHIKVNKPEGEELEKLTKRITDFKEVVTDLEALASLPEPGQQESQEKQAIETFDKMCIESCSPAQLDHWEDLKF